MRVKPPIAAHRAGNNLDSFKVAKDQGADVIELDIHMTKDRHLVVQYEPFVCSESERIYVGDATLSILNRAKVKTEGSSVLLLQDVLEFAREYNAELLIDVKNGPMFYPDIHLELVRLVYERGMQDRVSAMSFDHKFIYDLKHQDAFPLKAGILYVARLSHLKETIGLVGADFIETHNVYLTQETVIEAHEEGAEVYGWSTDDPDEIKRLLELGVDIITTDTPSIAAEVLLRYEQLARRD